MFYPSLLSLGWHLHIVFVGITLVGGVLSLSWLLKLKADEQKKWIKKLLIIGILGLLITGSFGGLGWKMGMMKHRGMNGMIKEVKEVKMMEIPSEMMKR